MLRFSLGTLLLVVLLVALGCAAMTNPTLVWWQVVFTSTALLVLAATVVAAFSSGAIRSFAGGFAIFGWGYLLLVFGPWEANVKPRLLTTASIAWLESMNDKQASQSAAIAQYMALSDASMVPGRSVSYLTSVEDLIRLGQPQPNGTYFHQIGQSLWTLALACIGGLLGRVVYVWNLRQQSQALEGSGNRAQA